MKSAKRWTTSGASTCSLCRETFAKSTNGIMCDIAGPVSGTTIVKFVCMGCAGPITTAVAGEEIIRRSAEDRARVDFHNEQARENMRRGGL